LTALTTCHCQELPSKKIRFDFTISEDDKSVVDDAAITFAFGRIPESDEVVHHGKSDALGKFMVEDNVIFGLMYTIRKNSYYPIYEREPLKSITLEQYQNLKQLNIDVTMRQIKKPIALYGRKIVRAIPEQNKPIGYDLMAADWVKPHGKGENSDMLFTFDRKRLGIKNHRKLEELIILVKNGHANNAASKDSYFEGLKEFYEKDLTYTYEDGAYHSAGHWQGSITVKFPNAKEGIIHVKDQFLAYSELTMPHLAPEEGYQSQWQREEDNAALSKTILDSGHFLRTRVKLDDKGNIISANYAKLVTDFDFDPRGRITFSYLFNPTANDRNLEFDPKKNLFKNLEIGEEIQKP
jgi:hypothetical protein